MSRIARAERYALNDVTCNDADAKIGDFVTIAGVNEVAVAGAGDVIIGTIFWKETLPGATTIETIYSEKKYVIFTETLAPGDYVKMGAADGNGNQRVAKWVEGTDAEKLKIGVCWVGGNADETGEILF